MKINFQTVVCVFRSGKAWNEFPRGNRRQTTSLTKGMVIRMMKNGNASVKAKRTRRIFASVISACLAAVILITALSFTVSAATSDLDTAGAVTPLSGANLSASDYYRLLHFNNEAFGSEAVYEFEKTGVNIEDFSHAAQLTQALRNTSLALTAVGLVTKAKLAVSPFKFITKMLSTYKINANNADMLNRLGEEMGDIYNALASDLDRQSEVIFNKIDEQSTYIGNKADYQTTKADLDDFLGDDFGGKGYNNWKSSLYLYYDQLIDFSKSNASASNMKSAYDALYNVAKEYTDLYDALTGSNAATTTPISETLYNFYLTRKALGEDIDMVAATEFCIEFTNDLYTTYVLAKTSMAMCYHYQVTTLRTNHGSQFKTNPYKLTSGAEVFYNVDIKPFIEKGESDLDYIAVRTSQFYAKILGTAETYLREDADGRVNSVVYTEITDTLMAEGYTVSKEGIAQPSYAIVNNRVSVGDTLHLNTLPVALTSGMAVNYSFVSSDESVATVTSDGVVTVKGSGDFTVYMTLGDRAIYAMSFTGSGKFSGGRGTKYSPYLISTLEDLMEFSKNSQYWGEEYYFEIYSEYALDGEKNIWIMNIIPQIGSLETPFRGHIDGRGTTFYNLKDKALFGVNEGTIKNINISTYSQTNSTEGAKYISNNNKIMAVGALANINRGSISNVNLYNVVIDVSSDYAKEVNYGNGSIYYGVNLRVGAIVGENSGSISNCVVNDCSLNSYQENGTYTHSVLLATVTGAPASNRIDSGAVAGTNLSDGYIIDCSVKDSNIKASIKCVSAYNDAVGSDPNPYPCTARRNLGSLVGYDSGQINRCVSVNAQFNTPKIEFETIKHGAQAETDYTLSEDKVFYYIGVMDGSGNHYYDSVPTGDGYTVMTQYGWDFSGALYKATASRGVWTVGILRQPAKVYYEKGGKLNLSGLLLNINAPATRSVGVGTVVSEGYTVSGFDSTEKGKKTVTVTYGGVSTTLEVEIACMHRVLQLSEVGENDEQVTCTVCGEQVMLLEAAQLEADVVHTHYHAEGATPVINREPTHTVEGEQQYTCLGCGEAYTEAIPKTTAHEFPNVWEQHSATQHKRTCPCGEVEYGPHTFGDWVQHTATQHKRSCSCGEIEYASHSFGDWVNYNDTQHKRVCECGGEEIVAHSFGPWEHHNKYQHKKTCACGGIVYEAHTQTAVPSVTKPADHFEEGVMTYTFSCCGGSYEESIPKNPEHVYPAEWTYHTKEQHKKVCACGAPDGVIYENHTASATSTVTKPADHFEEGVMTYTFSCCGGSYEEPIAKTPEHVYPAEWTYHTKDQHKKVCACGAPDGVIYENHTVSATSTVTKPADHFEEGVMTYTFSCCGGSYEEPIAKTPDHVYPDEWTYDNADRHKRTCNCDNPNTVYEAHSYTSVVTKPASHTEEGILTKTCSGCGNSYTEAIPKSSAHEYGAPVYFSKDKHKRTCPCGAAEVIYGEHTWDDGEVTAPATHTAEGTVTYTCGDCDGHKTESIPKLEGHTFNKEVATDLYLKSDATCTDRAVYYYSCECGEHGEATFSYGDAPAHSYDDEDDLICNKCEFERETPPMSTGDIILLIIGGLVFLAGCFSFYWFVIKS